MPRKVTDDGMNKIRELVRLHQQGCDRLGDQSLSEIAREYAREAEFNCAGGRGPVFEIPSHNAVGGESLTFTIAGIE